MLDADRNNPRSRKTIRLIAPGPTISSASLAEGSPFSSGDFANGACGCKEREARDIRLARYRPAAGPGGRRYYSSTSPSRCDCSRKRASVITLKGKIIPRARARAHPSRSLRCGKRVGARAPAMHNFLFLISGRGGGGREVERDIRVLKVEFSLSQYFSSGRIYRRTKGYVSAVYR